MADNTARVVPERAALVAGAFLDAEWLDANFVRTYPRESPKTGLDLMRFAQTVENILRVEQTGLHAKVERDGIRILMPADDTRYQEEMFRRGRRAMGRAYGKQIEIHPDDLDEDSRRFREQAINAGGLLLQAMKAAEKKALRAADAAKNGTKAKQQEILRLEESE